MGGEAKRRQAWIAKGGEDWGLKGYRPHTSNRSVELLGKTAEEREFLERARTNRRNLDRAKRAGFVAFVSQGVSKLSEAALLGNIRQQMKKRGASAAARRAAR